MQNLNLAVGRGWCIMLLVYILFVLISSKTSSANTNYLGTINKVIRLPAILAGRSTFAKSCNNSVMCSSMA